MFTHGNDVAFENIGSFWCISDPKLFEYDPQQFEYENMFNLKTTADLLQGCNYSTGSVVSIL